MVNSEGKIDFNLITLKSINGEFYFRKKGRLYTVSQEQFKILLVMTAKQIIEAPEELKTINKNQYDFLRSQLELTEELFEAELFSAEDWYI